MKALWWSGLILAIDQVTKMLIKSYMELYQIIDVLGKYVRLRYILNPGIAFGIQFGGRVFFTVFTSIACLIILIFLFRLKEDHFWTRMALGLILGGALGNLIDRIVFGQVIDFIEIGPWPIFNVADIAVTFGMVVLILVVFFEKKERKESQEEKFEVSC